ncbi:hypothetical protein Mgra_00008890 [Meloidogyne graminicola]|uniref:Uncharacterized protein n=1 Tax=Meloidogyne graminicola TaxID=189291 RepID=A0A8S9ZEE0_9BILA|nr:hypothetical protein Mgra_00008890 [Meloidogyne graminicola]
MLPLEAVRSLSAYWGRLSTTTPKKMRNLLGKIVMNQLVHWLE